ncbi:hypothetical protein AHAS_Ahas14G0168900 [Arachis hypogaea]
MIESSGGACMHGSIHVLLVCPLQFPSNWSNWRGVECTQTLFNVPHWHNPFESQQLPHPTHPSFSRQQLSLAGLSTLTKIQLHLHPSGTLSNNINLQPWNFPPSLDFLYLFNNKLTVITEKVTANTSNNGFCLDHVGTCDKRVTTLLQIAAGFRYPPLLVYLNLRFLMSPITIYQGTYPISHLISLSILRVWTLIIAIYNYIMSSVIKLIIFFTRETSSREDLYLISTSLIAYIRTGLSAASVGILFGGRVRFKVYNTHVGTCYMQHVGAWKTRGRAYWQAWGVLTRGEACVMEGTANLVVYRNGEIIRNTHEGVRFVCQNQFSFVVSCTMTLMKFQNGLCQSMENGMLRRVSRILYQNPVVVFGGLIQFDIMPIIDEASMQNMFQTHRQTQMRQPQIELYVEFKNVEVDGIQNDLDIEDDRAAVYERMNSDSKEDFEATYEAGDKDEDGDVGVEAAAENVVVHPSGSQPMNVLPFMRNLDLNAMHAPEFSEYANIGVVDPEDGEFRIGMEYSSRKSVVAAIRTYTISRVVDYNVYEYEPQTMLAEPEPGGCAESSGCAESAKSGGCAKSGGYADCAYYADCAHYADCDVCDDCLRRGRRIGRGGWTHCGECDGYHDFGSVAVVYNKETAQTLHAEVDLEVQVAIVLVADMDDEECAPTISSYVHTSPHTNPVMKLHSAKMQCWSSGMSLASRGRGCAYPN